MSYFPFNSSSGDRVYKAEDWASYFSAFISNGVFPQPDAGLQVLENENMQISVNPGFGFINGYMFWEENETYLTVATADGSFSRIDRVVLRWSLEDRMIYLDILQGATATDPVAPDLTQDDDVWEICLAEIDVAAGATEITQSMITDTRYDSDLCGICAGLIDQIDFTEITVQFESFFAQYQASVISTFEEYEASLAEYEETQQENFEAWFETIKDILDDDAAGNLQLEIEELEEEISTRIALLEYMVLQNDFYLPLIDDDGTILVDDEDEAVLANFKYKEV